MKSAKLITALIKKTEQATAAMSEGYSRVFPQHEVSLSASLASEGGQGNGRANINLQAKHRNGAHLSARLEVQADGDRFKVWLELKIHQLQPSSEVAIYREQLATVTQEYSDQDFINRTLRSTLEICSATKTGRGH